MTLQPAAVQKPVLVVMGPTASGKSALALALAEAFEGVVINMDSMQVYRELPILTARPGPADCAKAPHRLYGFLAGDAPCSAGRWRDLALAEIGKAQAAGRLPILTGGTGLYFRALSAGIAEVPEIPAAVRAEAERLFETLGGAAFHARLAARDPQTAARLHVNDRQRLVRAWEVLEGSGRPLADWQAEQADARPADLEGLDFRTLVVEEKRERLYARCDARFVAMLDAGALAEVRALRDLGYDENLPVMRALGVPELLAYLAGGITLERAIELAQTKTRRYAKRQLTWLRHQVLGNYPNVLSLDAQLSKRFDNELFNNIRQKMLTPRG